MTYLVKLELCNCYIYTCVCIYISRMWPLNLIFFPITFRSIVGRRFFFIIGTLYLYRCITMYVTTLPVPGMHFQCAPKVGAFAFLILTLIFTWVLMAHWSKYSSKYVSSWVDSHQSWGIASSLFSFIISSWNNLT